MASISSPQVPWSELERMAFYRRAAEADAICGRVPKFVVEPATADEVAAVLRWANTNSVALAARGNGTKAGWGAPPRALDVVLSAAQDEARDRACMGRYDRDRRARLHRR